MKKPAILIMAATWLLIGVLVLDFHITNNQSLSLIPEDYAMLVETVSNQESKILLVGESLPFPESIDHEVVSSIDDLSKVTLNANDFIIIHIIHNTMDHGFSIDQINTLRSLNNQGISIIFVGLSSDDFMNINHEISDHYPYGVGVIKMNPNSFDQGQYEIYAPNTNNLELRLYNVLRLMVSK